MNVQDEKFDRAVAFLRDQDKAQGGGSYFEECAGMLEELLGQVFALEEAMAAAKPAKRKPVEYLTNVLPNGTVERFKKTAGHRGNQPRP